MIDLGTVRPGSTIRIPFASFDKDDGSSITMTNYAAADILIYKDGSTTERASTAGFTATTDFDSKTGKHLAVIDLADDTTADFYKAGSEYLVAIDAVTVDTVTTGGWIARFRIGYPNAYFDTSIATLASQTSFTLTAGPAEDDALNGMVLLVHDKASAVQVTRVVVEDYTGASKTVTLRAAPATTFTIAAGDNVSAVGFDAINVTHFGGSAGTFASGRPEVNTTHFAGTAITAAAGIPEVKVASIAANAITAAATAADFSTEVNAAPLAILGTPAGASLAADVAAVKTQTAAIETDTAEIGAAGAGLTVLATQASVNTIDDFLDTEVAAILAAVDTEVAAIKAVTDLLPNGGALTSLATAAALAAVAADLPHRYTRAVEVTGFTFFMRDSTTHTAATGLTVTAERSIDGGALAACANAVSEISNGLYKITLATTDMDGVTITLRLTAAGADDLVIILPTQPT